MSALTQRLSLAPAQGMPGRVRFALLLLWVAWVGSACGLGLHLYQSWRAPLDLYSVLGFPALLAQALLIALIARGYNPARWIAVAVAIPAFVAVRVLLPDLYAAAPFRINAEAALRLSALVLLLTPAASQWFRATGSATIAG